MRTNLSRLSFYLVAVALLTTSPCAQADSVSFTVLPSGVSGPAGSTVGWGYSITNNSTTDYLDLTGIDSDLFFAVDGTPDASIFNFPNLAPGQTMTQVFDPLNDLGLFQFTWNLDVPTGITETGNFTLYGAFCDPSDPFCADDLSVPAVALASTSYSATVTSNFPPPVSEPSTFALLICLACSAIFVLKLVRMASKAPNISANGAKPPSDARGW